MLNCSGFSKRLDEFIDGSLSYVVESAMKEHMNTCSLCRKKYEEASAADSAFRDALCPEPTEYGDLKEGIIRNIDTSRYNKRIANKFYFHVIRYAAAYAVCALLILLSFLSPYLYGIYKGTADKPGDKNLGTVKIDAPVTPEVTTPTPTPALPKTSVVESPLPMPDNPSSPEAKRLLQRMKNENLGAVPWIVGFSDSKRTIFYNYSCLLAYSYSGGKGDFYGAIDLKKIDGGRMQGSEITNFDFSPDGNYVVINNGQYEEASKFTANMYFFDFTKNIMKILMNVNHASIVDSWSDSSSLYVFGDNNLKRIVVYDVQSGRIKQIPFKKGMIKKINISDSGDILVSTDNMKYLLKKASSYSCSEINIPGEVLSVKSGSILYFNAGTVYKYSDSQSYAVQKFGTSFALKNQAQKYAVFSDGAIVYVFDYDKGFLRYDFSQKNYEDVYSLSTDLKKCLVRYPTSKVVDIDGQKYPDFVERPWSSDFYWLDNNSLVRIAQKDENSMALSGFVLYKSDLIIK